MSNLSPLIIKAENLIKEFKLNITTNNLDTQSAIGTMKGVPIRITILYNRKTVVFTHILTNCQVIKVV